MTRVTRLILQPSAHLPGVYLLGPDAETLERVDAKLSPPETEESR